MLRMLLLLLLACIGFTSSASAQIFPIFQPSGTVCVNGQCSVAPVVQTPTCTNGQCFSPPTATTTVVWSQPVVTPRTVVRSAVTPPLVPRFANPWPQVLPQVPIRTVIRNSPVWPQSSYRQRTVYHQ